MNDIKHINAKSKNNRVNTQLQNYLFSVLQDNHVSAAKRSLDVMIELYRKRVWNDAKTVNVIATACLGEDQTLSLAALKFFLGADRPEERQEDEDEEIALSNKQRLARRRELSRMFLSSTQTKNRKRQMKRELAKLQKSSRKVATGNKDNSGDFAALQLLNDPQDFAEKLYRRVAGGNANAGGAVTKTSGAGSVSMPFEDRLLYLTLISRLIGGHQLILLNFYPYCGRYLKPHQEHVSTILALLAQSCHDLIPPESIEPIIKSLVDNFVTDKANNAVMALGINSIRAICTRMPYVMNEDLLQDLVQYKSSKDKGVMMAARSLIALYREVDPSMLAKKDRGRDGALMYADRTLPQFGQSKTNDGVEGIELLGQLPEGEAGEGEGQEDGWETASMSSSGSGSWQDVSDDEGAPEVEMSEDEEEQAERLRREAEDAAKPSIDRTRILTPADFRLLEQLKAAQKKQGSKGMRRGEKRDRTIDYGAVVDPTDLEGFVKRQKATLEERLERIREGREGSSFGSKRNRREKAGGKSNREQMMAKPFMLTRFSQRMRAKKNASSKEKTDRLRRHVVSQKDRFKKVKF